MRLSVVKKLFYQNSSAKISAFVIALILWFALINKREFETSKMYDVEFIVPIQAAIADLSVSRIKVTVASNRVLLKKLNSNHEPSVIFLDASHLSLGQHRIRIDKSNIELPIGIKVISIIPSVVEFQIKENP